MLSYEIILKTLMPEKNTFSLQPNITNHDLGTFNKLFDSSFYRYGVFSDISLKSSILCCIDTNYHNLLYEQINEQFSNNISDIVKDFNINIIIFDYKNNNIYAEYNGDFLNPWKPTIYLANYNDWFEPIITKDTRIFSLCSFKSHILKNNILSQTILKFNTDIPITINDNFNEIVELEGFKKKSISLKSKYEKMKKDDLIQLCVKMNKTIEIVKPTKKDLIDIILNE